MPNQSVRQAARRAALDAQIRVRRRQEERDKRRSRLGVILVTALAERDAQIEFYESRAAEAVESLLVEEGMTVGAVADWCGLSSREVRRLRSLGRLVPMQMCAVASSSDTDGQG